MKTLYNIYGIVFSIALNNELVKLIIEKKFAHFKVIHNTCDVKCDMSIVEYDKEVFEPIVIQNNDPYYKIDNNEIVLEKYGNSFLKWDLYKDQIGFYAADDDNHNAIGWRLIDYINNVLVTKGIFYIHASCYSQRGEGVVLCGECGAGKTSLSLKALENKKTIVSDDSTYFIEMDSKYFVLANKLRPNIDENNLSENFSYLGNNLVSDVHFYKKSVDISEINFGFSDNLKIYPGYIFSLLDKKDTPQICSISGASMAMRIIKEFRAVSFFIHKQYTDFVIKLCRQTRNYTLFPSYCIDESYKLLESTINHFN